MLKLLNCSSVLESRIIWFSLSKPTFYRLIFRIFFFWFFGKNVVTLHLMTCNLKDLPEEVHARVIGLTGDTSSIQYLMGMGLHNNILIRIVKRLFFGSNYVVEVDNEQIVLRKHEVQCLKVTTSY